MRLVPRSNQTKITGLLVLSAVISAGALSAKAAPLEKTTTVPPTNTSITIHKAMQTIQPSLSSTADTPHENSGSSSSTNSSSTPGVHTTVEATINGQAVSVPVNGSTTQTTTNPDGSQTTSTVSNSQTSTGTSTNFSSSTTSSQVYSNSVSSSTDHMQEYHSP